MTNESSLTERLKTARERAGFTKAEASRQLQLSKIGYNRYESGDRTPSRQMLTVIAQRFNTSLAYLEGTTDNMDADYIIVSANDSPDLFSLVEKCKNADGTTLNLLKAYLDNLPSAEEEGNA